MLCAQCMLSRACACDGTYHETLPGLMLECCRATQAGLRFLMQHQQEGCASAFVRSGFKPDTPGGVDCWAYLLRFVLPFSSQFLSYRSHILSLLPFPFPHNSFLEKGGWERKYSIKPLSANLHFHSAYGNGQARLLLGLSTT